MTKRRRGWSKAAYMDSLAANLNHADTETVRALDLILFYVIRGQTMEQAVETWKAVKRVEEGQV